ncbi:MAG: anthranilate synthase component I family protein [Myxococcota bacterium]
MLKPADVVAGLVDRPGLAWLDGADDTGTIVTWDPVDVVTRADGWPAAGRARTRAVATGAAPFTGGVLGYVGYGAGHVVDAVPRCAPTPEPDVWLGRFDGGLCWRGGEWTVAGTPGFRRDAERVLAAAGARPPPPAPSAPRADTDDRAGFEARVERVRAWIAEGDCYQVNLSRPVRVPAAGDPFHAYLRLRSRPAAYGAFLRPSDEIAVLSNSPELLLSQRGRRLRSVPIKGTRPRSADPARDAAFRAELEASPKDRAELTMITDLVRNDLGRVARVGTVRAEERQLTDHPTLFHTSWPVEAELAEGLDAWDALAAVFPPGSVTGAPKVRACQRIAELEPAPRGVYCGAIGYVADGGDATWSVAIRVAVFDGADARYHVGGGIVDGSDPAAEWEETVTKELALRRALVRLDPS